MTDKYTIKYSQDGKTCSFLNDGQSLHATVLVSKLNELHQLWSDRTDYIAALKTYAKQSSDDADSPWISADVLPKDDTRYLLECVSSYDASFTYNCIGYFVGKKQHEEDNIDCHTEYDKESDKYYLISGWYETLMNWDEYGAVFINDTVIAYRQLPEKMIK